MGWSFFHDKKRDDVIAYLRHSLAHGGTTVRQSSAIGNDFWALLKRDDGRLLIAHIIIKGGTRQYPGWGYKELSHRDGITCPIEYLRHLPETEDARELEWREAIRAHHLKQGALKKAKKGLAPGLELTFNGKRYRLGTNLQRRGWVVYCLDDGLNYRMPVTHINSAIKAVMAAEAATV